MRNHTTLTLIAALASMLTLGACQQRALHMIEASGDHAMYIGDYPTAVSEYSEVVQRRPGRWHARVELGRALLALDRPAEAREQLEVASTIKPENIEVLELLADAMLQSGDVEAMTTELRLRAEASGEVSDWMRLGIFQQKAGDYDEAELALLTAARLDAGEHVEVQMALASLYREAGDDPAALRRLRMALFLAPGDAEINQAIRSYGEVPGPTYALVPEELRSHAEAE